MIVLQLNKIKKSYDAAVIVEDASFIIRSGDKVGLVGANGAGKSTLVRIATGEESPDHGEVTVKDDVTIGYVSQFINANEDATVYEFVATAKAKLRAMEDELRRLEQEMAKPQVYEDESRFEATSAKYDRLSHEFAQRGGYAWQTDIRRVLTGLAFPVDWHDRPVKSLSGGQKTRLSLARLLAMEPTLLVLDEPTNYLDTDTLTWLESYLKSYEGSILVVSHDRYFLDEITNQTVELENGTTTSYVGNYDRYVEQKVQARLQQAKAFAHQQEEIDRLETFVQKNLARASTTKRAQSRRRMLERMDRVESPDGPGAKVHLGFDIGRPSGRDVLLVDDLAIGYRGNQLAQHIKFRLERGMRLAILGPNGVGKTTLLKTLLSQLPALSGSHQFGQHVRVAYYDQEQSNLDGSKTVLSQIWDEHPAMDRGTVRGLLAQFLFRGSDVDKPVTGLSGGERSRLSLCRLMLEKANTLFMDEPTNHLDIPSKEVLEDALVDYEGTLLFVSHDRYFIDSIATHVAVLTEDGLTLFIGNYSDYRNKLAENERLQEILEAEQQKLSQRAQEDANKSQNANVGRDRSGTSTASPEKTTTADDHSGTQTQGRRRIRSSDVRKAREAVAKFEHAATACEESLTETAEQLSEAAQAQDLDAIRDLEARRISLERKHEETVEAWEVALLELEELEELERSMGEGNA